MPTMKVRPDENGRINLADIAHIALGDIEALEVTSPNDAATGKAIKLADARVQVIAKVPQHGENQMATYTVALTVTREPVTEAETVACGTKADAQKARKADEERKQQEATARSIKLVQEAERAAADRVAQRDAAVLENTIKVLSNVHAK